MQEIKITWAMAEALYHARSRGRDCVYCERNVAAGLCRRGLLLEDKFSLSQLFLDASKGAVRLKIVGKACESWDDSECDNIASGLRNFGFIIV